MKPRTGQVTLIGDSDPPPTTVEAAEAIGALVARRGLILVTGGLGGVMEAACRGAVSAGGTTVGILPGNDIAGANKWCTIVVPTGLGHGRNLLTALAGDIVIAVGGGAGTLSEMSFAWMHKKPILSLTGHAGWAEKLSGERVDLRRRDTVIPCRDLETLDRELVAVCAKLSLKIIV